MFNTIDNRLIAQHIPDNVRRYGYYEYEGQIFLNKVKVISHVLDTEGSFDSRVHDRKLKYIFNDDLLNQYDWKTEPEPYVDITEFYRRRATQLREKYDYVVLMYSGGPDSTNVLRTFVDNNLKIDEIVNFNSYKETGILKDTLHNNDYVHNVEPTLKRLIIDNNLKTKITVVDEVDATKKYWKWCHEIGYDELLFENVSAPSMFLARPIGFKFIPHIWDMIQSGKKICIVVGSDKADIAGDPVTGKYFWFTGDVHKYEVGANHLNIDELKNFNGFEFFYHSPDCIPLMIKQAHILKNYMDHSLVKSDYEFDDPSVPITLRPRKAFYCPNKNLKESNLRYDIYHRLLYPDWNPAIITPKPDNLVTRPQDNWWIHDIPKEDRNVFVHGLMNGIRKYSQLGFHPSRFMQFPPVVTKRRYIE